MYGKKNCKSYKSHELTHTNVTSKLPLIFTFCSRPLNHQIKKEQKENHI
jgi:hypothetical protein